MEREIKFKIWDAELEKMFGEFDLKFGFINPLENGQTLLQYTGLKDKNGNPIYEGDILKAIDVLLTVWYNDATASFDVLHYGDETGDTESLYSNIESEIPLEVIGNIYQNHELLKQ